VIGRSYVENGRRVVVLMRWGEGSGPRNVLIEREDGSRVVRPFRGLRRERLPLEERSAGRDRLME